jgi:hypothetical protein
MKLVHDSFLSSTFRTVPILDIHFEVAVLFSDSRPSCVCCYVSIVTALMLSSLSISNMSVNPHFKYSHTVPTPTLLDIYFVTFIISSSSYAVLSLRLPLSSA